MSTKNQVSQLTLERLVNKELAAEEEAALLLRLEQDDELNQKYQTLLRDNEEILAQYPPMEMARDILERFEKY